MCTMVSTCALLFNVFSNKTSKMLRCLFRGFIFATVQVSASGKQNWMCGRNKRLLESGLCWEEGFTWLLQRDLTDWHKLQDSWPLSHILLTAWFKRGKKQGGGGQSSFQYKTFLFNSKVRHHLFYLSKEMWKTSQQMCPLGSESQDN